MHAPALAGDVHRELERCHLRLVAEMPRQQLIDRDVGDDFDLGSSTARRAGQKRAGRAGMDVFQFALMPDSTSI